MKPPASLTSAQHRQRPEILAPAGGRPQLEAAVWAGADAVYFGLDTGLNARVRATSFKAGELPATMAYLHERGVRGYLTLNTLVFDEELAQAEQLIRMAAEAGVDALIVQDMGLAQLARAVAPNLPLHGSTQMSITDAAGVVLAQELGCRRVVLGRELSIDEIATIRADSGLEIEVFVHGALCVSYSGQCFSSEAWGGRSANRGQCAQACRLPYGLIVDGAVREQGDMQYLLSPQDLMALELLPRLIDAGVGCLKIEGRLKGPEYVLATVTAYREAVDRITTNHNPDRMYPVPRSQRRRLAQAFARGQSAEHDGLTPGFLEGPQHQSLVIGRNPKHRGVFVGTVEKVTDTGIATALRGPLKRGDGLVFDRGRPDAKETGGHVFDIINETGESVAGEPVAGRVELRFAKHFPLDRIEPGTLLWRTRDSAQDGAPHLDPRLAACPVMVNLSLSGELGEPPTLTISDRDGHVVRVVGSVALQAATGKPLDADKIQKAIGTLGDTPFVIDALDIDASITGQPVFLPLGEIKALRRDATARLLNARQQHDRAKALAEPPVLPRLLPDLTKDLADNTPKPNTQPGISLLCRTRAQVEAALLLDDVDEIVVDFLEVHGLKEACILVREHQRRLVVAAPRIFKPGEQRLWRYFCRLQPDALLVRSAGLLWQLHALGGEGALLDDSETVIPALHGDFSLNAANVLSARKLLAMGLQRLALTHDLNGKQVAALARALPARERSRIEVIAHQHLPIFHTEYCLFARFLSRGNSYRDCGRPCESHVVHVRDPAGGDHLVQADIGCRNTVFNAAAQSAAPLLHSLVDAGIRHYRIELVDEPADEVTGIVDGYHDALSGRLRPKVLVERLGKVRDANGNRQGVGLGSLAVRTEPARASLKKPTAR